MPSNEGKLFRKSQTSNAGKKERAIGPPALLSWRFGFILFPEVIFINAVLPNFPKFTVYFYEKLSRFFLEIFRSDRLNCESSYMNKQYSHLL